MAGKDVWDSIAYSPEIKATVDRLMSNSQIRVERRGSTTYYPGRLFTKDENGEVLHHKVVVADQGADTYTVISMDFIRRNQNAVLVMRLGDGKSMEHEGSITKTRPGKRASDSNPDNGKVKRFIAEFRPAQ